MRLLPDYTILLAYLAGIFTCMYVFPRLDRKNTLIKPVVAIGAYIVLYCILTSIAYGEGFADASGNHTLDLISGKLDLFGEKLNLFGKQASDCPKCGSPAPCPVHKEVEVAICPPMPDMSKYVLKSSIPPCPRMPDMDNYMLKSECPPVPDMSQYVLKSSIPKQGPIIIDTSADNKARCGDCPPCPRPRCPEVICPPAPKCPVPPPCPRPVCPQQVVKCKAEEVGASSRVRPFLAPLDFTQFG